VCAPLTAPPHSLTRSSGGGEHGARELSRLLSFHRSPATRCALRADSKDNTPLHYAAGYGREAAVALLLDAGADVSVKNSTGKTAADLAKLDERNPLSKNAELLARLQP
jgi:ankyrin repeat protein